MVSCHCRRRVFDLAQLRSAKALYVLVSEFGSTRATSLGLPLEFFRATHGAFDKVGLDQVGSRFCPLEVGLIRGFVRVSCSVSFFL